MKAYVFGNPILEKDNLALKILPKLREIFKNSDIIFKEFDVIEDLEEGNLIIIDAAVGIKEVKLIDDLNSLESKKIYSLHDYDLSYELKLQKKIGKIKDVKIIAIPFDLDEKEALEQVKNYIHLILKK